MFAQITREAFALQNVKIVLGFFPWERASQLSRTGQWDGTIAFAKLKEREAFYLYSLPLYEGRYVLFHLKSHPLKWSQYKDLSQIQMASTRGFGGMGDEFLAAERSGVIKVLRLTSDTQSFHMLKAARVQAVPSDLEVGYVMLRRIYGSQVNLFTHSTRVIQSSPYHLVISKKTKKAQILIDKFNEGLTQLKKSGRYDEIIRTWYSKAIYKDAVPPQHLKKP